MKTNRHLAFSIYCNEEDRGVINKLQHEHSLNVSEAVREYLRRKLEQLERLKKGEQL